MRADTVKLAQIFGSHTRQRVPLFQRPHVWQKDRRWQLLRVGLREVAEGQMDANPPNYDFAHFLGAIVDQEVTANAPSLRLAVDGQQRLTTLRLVIAATRALAVQHGHGKSVLITGALNAWLSHTPRTSVGGLSGRIERSEYSQLRQGSRNASHHQPRQTVCGRRAVAAGAS